MVLGAVISLSVTINSYWFSALNSLTTTFTILYLQRYKLFFYYTYSLGIFLLSSLSFIYIKLPFNANQFIRRGRDIASKTKDSGNVYLQKCSRCFSNIRISVSYLTYCKRNHINAFLVPKYSRIFVRLQYLLFFYISFLLHWQQHQLKYRLCLIRKKN